MKICNESDIVADYGLKMTLNQLAKKYKCRNTTVRKVLESNGVRVRTFGEHAKKHTLNEDYFEKIDTEEKAYILGFIYADGNIYINKRQPGTIVFQMALQKRDAEMDVFTQRKAEIILCQNIIVLPPHSTRIFR